MCGSETSKTIIQNFARPRYNFYITLKKILLKMLTIAQMETIHSCLMELLGKNQMDSGAPDQKLPVKDTRQVTVSLQREQLSTK